MTRLSSAKVFDPVECAVSFYLSRWFVKKHSTAYSPGNMVTACIIQKKNNLSRLCLCFVTDGRRNAFMGECLGRR